ncbi:peroxiredoxin [Georgenia alba]|uniref:thioredoxin-dependent peroxiredoxin n=1 Tax=Georgenia alba TaxID=2233858 RepID=A0ABW2QA78_9MICO
MSAPGGSGLPSVGSPAPDLELPDTRGTPVRLSALRGTPVALVFYPFAFSHVCHAELAELRDHLPEFTGRGVRVLGISTDSMFTLRAWDDEEGFGFDLLSDFWPHGEVSRCYGVFDDAKGHARRGSFLLDADGIVRWSVLSPAGQARDLAEYRAALTRLPS